MHLEKPGQAQSGITRIVASAQQEQVDLHRMIRLILILVKVVQRKQWRRRKVEVIVPESITK